MAAQSIQDWDDLSDDSKWIFESLGRLGFSDFGSLTTADQSLVVGFALHLKRTAQKAEIYQS